jgi:hypothetical protein
MRSERSWNNYGSASRGQRLIESTTLENIDELLSTEGSSLLIEAYNKKFVFSVNGQGVDIWRFDPGRCRDSSSSA